MDIDLAKGNVFHSIVPRTIPRLFSVFAILLVGMTVELLIEGLFQGGFGDFLWIGLIAFVGFVFLLAALFVLIERFGAGRVSWMVTEDRILITREHRKKIEWPYARIERIRTRIESGLTESESQKYIIRLHVRTASGRMIRYAIRLTTQEGFMLKEFLEARMSIVSDAGSGIRSKDQVKGRESA